MTSLEAINTRPVNDLKVIFDPILKTLSGMGTKSSFHVHDQDYLMITISDTENSNADFRIFVKPDGLIEMTYNDGETEFGQLYGSHNLESYIQFEHDFALCVRNLRGDNLFSQHTRTFHLSIAKHLRAQHFITNQDFHFTPSEQHAQWQLARSNRDGQTPSGQRIPHLG